MKIGLIIADFESSYSTSFQHTARVKYEVDFNTSNVDTLGMKLVELKEKVQSNHCNDIHVGLEITLEHVQHIEHLLNQILCRYKEVFNYLPNNRKIYTINQRLREHEIPPVADLAKEVVDKIFTPELPTKLTKAQRIQADAEALSRKKVLDLIHKNSAKK